MWESLGIGDLTNALTTGGLYADLTAPNSPYALQPEGYTPVAAPRRATSGLGGYGPYQTVTEPLSLYARGATPAEALAAADWLLRLAERAPLLANFDIRQAAPVRLYAQPLGSATLYDALVVDVAPEPLVLAPTPQQEGGWQIPITLTITRQAEWRAAGETQQSTTDNQPALQTVTFAGVDPGMESPCTAGVIWGVTPLAGPLNALLLWGEQRGGATPRNDVALMTAPAAAPAAFLPATGWSSFADAAGNNPPANVLRYTASGTAEAPTALDPLTGGGHPLLALVNMQRPLVVVVCRSNSASAGFLLRAEGVNQGINTLITARTRMTPIAYNGGQPQIVPLGVMSAAAFAGGLRLVAQAVDATGSPTLDISQIALLDTSSPLARRVALTQNSVTSASGLGARSYESDLSVLGFGAVGGRVTGLSPADPTLSGPVNRFAGDAWVTVGTYTPNAASVTMGAALLLTHGQYWRLTQSGPLAVPATLRVRRRRAWRLPQ